MRAPLKEAGLSKGVIRAASRALGLPTAAKPAMPCLSSRIPYGEEVTREKVAMIEQAENMLRDLGFTEVRVRHHQGGKGGPKARIEVGTDELERLRDETFERTEASLKAIGYNTVDVDRRGYRRGSLNTVPADEVNSAE